MQPFDLNNYFAKRQSLAPTSKIDELQAASTEKVRALQESQARDAIMGPQIQQEYEDSWVGKLGLNSKGVVGTLVNQAASFASGASRVAGQLASLPTSIAAAADMSSVSEDEIAAFNRERQGIATPADLELLTRKKAFVSPNDTPEAKARAQQLADANPDGLTARDLITRAQRMGDTSRSIAKATDISSIVEPTRRRELNRDLGDQFQSAWDQTGLANLFEKNKSIGAPKDVAIGLGRLLYNAIEAGITNPGASTEYITENLPQILGGLAGKAGKVALTASNVGYAADNYQQGLENYAKANNGQLPPPEERQKMALYAASTFLADQVGDFAQLGAIGKVRKAADVGTDAAGDAARIGFKQSVLNVGKAGAAGYGTEALTEGYQTFAEGEAQLKPASAEDIYKGAAIGGLAGGGTTAGGRAVAEALGATPEKVAVERAKVKQDQVLRDAVATGNVDPLLDPTSRAYSPYRAIDALQANSKRADATEEQKQTNFERASQIVSSLQARLDLSTPEGLQTKIDTAREQLASLDPANTAERADLESFIGELETELNTVQTTDNSALVKQLQDDLAKATQSLADFSQERQIAEVDVDTEVAKINGTDAVESQASASRLINLSMAIPERLDVATAKALAENTGNGLTPAQRDYFRSFTAAREVENSTKNLDAVTRDISQGGKGFVGLSQYRQATMAAVSANDRQSADSQLRKLDTFAADYADKQAKVSEAWDRYQSDGKPLVVRKHSKLGWVIQPGNLSEAKRAKEGAVNINSGSANLVGSIQSGAAAIQATQSELRAAYNLKFNTTTQENVNGTQANETQQTETQRQKAANATGTEQTSSQADVLNTAGTQGQSSENQQSSQETTTAAQTTESSAAVDTAGSETSVSETAPDTAEAGTLRAVQQKSEGVVALQQKKLGDMFIQVAATAKSATSRPLVAVKNLMTAWANGTVKLGEFIKGVDSLSDAQKVALRTFAERAKAWAPLIQRALKPASDPKFNFEDPIRYLIEAKGVNGESIADIEQNVKTAITAAVFAYVNDQASHSGLDTDSDINAKLGRDKEELVLPEAREVLQGIGMPRNQVVDALGSKVMDALGFRELKDTPQDMQAKLRMSLGAAALKLMDDPKVGLLMRTDIANDVIARLRKGVTLDEFEEMSEEEQNKTLAGSTGRVTEFYALPRSNPYAVEGEAKLIADAMSGSKNILQNLFGLQPAAAVPSLEPSTEVQKKTDSGMQLPKFMRKIFRQKQQEAWYVNQDPLAVLGDFSEEEALEMAGVVSMAHTHESNKASKQAKNDGLTREFRQLMEFIGEYVTTSEKGLNQPFYYSFDMWKQQRSGFVQNVGNPNASKIARWLVAPKEWESKIDLNDVEQVQNFKLRAAEGFGRKVEKFDEISSEIWFDKLVQSPEMAEAIKALQQKLYDKAELSDAQRAAVKAAVKQGGQKFHTLAALIAVAHYKQALDKKQSEFTTNLMGEVDGVTNGSILNHVLYGAAATVDGLNALLERGGIYTIGSKFRQYSQWRSEPGHKDFYETTAQKLYQALAEQTAGNSVLNAIWNVMNVPVTDDAGATTAWSEESTGFSKNGRDLAKGAVNPLNYGSGLKKIKQGMSAKFYEGILAQLEKFSEQGVDQATLNAFIGNINFLLQQGKAKPLPLGKPIASYMKQRFTDSQIRALTRQHELTVGEAMAKVVKQEFGEFLGRSKQLIRATNTSFEIYNAIYEATRISFLKEKGVEVNGKGEPIHDLTAEQEKELQDRLAVVYPVMGSVMSEAEGSTEAGLLMAKKKRKVVNRPGYSMQATFATATSAGYKIMRLNGLGNMPSNPGVLAVSAGTHSLDSSISHRTQEGRVVLNNHDAIGDGVGTLASTANALNQNTWNALLEYSPLDSAYAMLMNTVRGVLALNEAGLLTGEAKAAVAKSLAKLAKKDGITPQLVLDFVAADLFDAARTANETKFGSMAQWAAVDQYAYGGKGVYEVTKEDRDEAQKRLQSVAQTMSQADTDALNAVHEILFGQKERQALSRPEPKPTVASVFGEFGQSTMPSDPQLVDFFGSKPVATAAEVIELLAQPGRLNAINRKLLQLVSRTVSPTLSIRYVTSETAESTVLDKPTTPARAWYVAAGTAEEIYVLSPDFKNSGLTAETLLHELIHAAIAKTIDSPSAQAKALVAELEALREKAKEYAAANGLTQFNAALANVQEFVAWGMSNLEFQRDVLTKIQMESKTKGNPLVSGMQKFISTLTQLLFKKPDQNLENGLSVLVSNVSGLFYEAGQARTSGTKLNLAMAAAQAVDSFSTQELFEALDTGAVQPDFKDHLTNLLTGIVERLHGPFGAFAAGMRRTEAGNPLAIWLKALETGKAPFASAIVASGFTGSAQEDFVMEQVEATVKAALDGNEATTKAVYRELYKLYTEVNDKLTPADFVAAGMSQADYDFVFKIESNGQRSDYLARFAALGLGSQRFNQLLKMATDRNPGQTREGSTWMERLANVFSQILAFFNEKITNTYAGQQADQKLLVLVEQLVDIEAKKRQLVKAGAFNEILEAVEEKASDAAAAVRQTIFNVANMDIVKKSGSGLVRFGGTLVRVSTKGVLDEYLEDVKKFRDSMFKEKHGLAMTLMSDVLGPIQRLDELLRARKKQEQARKTVITQTTKLASKMFANEGRDLTDNQKSAITRVFLRTGAHKLLGAFALTDMDKLLTDKTELQNQIDALEAQLPANLRDAYVEQINGLGFYNATQLVKTEILMFNAHLIARMSGTLWANKITEQQAQAAEPVIAQLVSLYGLKYQRQEDLNAAVEVLRSESARTDNINGVEFVLSMHKQQEQESLEKLFKGNPALMVHGYTAEILNPHTVFQVVGEEEGKALEEQGYRRNDEVVNDPLDESNEPKHVYVLKHGAQAPWLSQIMSLTDTHTKGALRQSGYLNANSLDGVLNASMQTTITNRKVAAVAKQGDPRRDLSKAKDNNLAPVYNENGAIVNWRYLMAGTTKDRLLERNNSFDTILGTTAGSIFDKQTYEEVNNELITALREQYEAEYALNSQSFVEVSATSTDPDIQERWNLLPDSTKDQIEKVWGRRGMKVKKDALDIVFGYRKAMLADSFMRSPETRNAFEKFTLEMLESYLEFSGRTPEQVANHMKKIGYYVGRGEKIWQAIVQEIKDIIVVKNVSTLVGNIKSNWSQLFLQGVSLKEIVHHHTVAIRGALAYQRDEEKLAELQKLANLGYTQSQGKDIQREMLRLRDLLDRNPVKELMEAGMLPTIVEDVAMDDDIYSYKNELAKKTDKYTSMLPEGVRNAGRFIYMAHDTKLYQMLSQATQLSDFVARYTLYQHLVGRENEPMAKQDALNRISGEFINYDQALPRQLQYLDDMGIVPFTKYFLRIQRVLVKNFRENPGRVLTTALIDQYYDLGPIVLDSSFAHHIGNNPIYGGALRYPATLDELLTIKAPLAVIK